MITSLTHPHRTRFTAFLQALLAAALLTLSPAGALAQTTNNAPSATIRGKVWDSENHPLSGATVTLDGSDSPKPLLASTDSFGRFHFTSLSGGTYTIRAKMPGYLDEISGPHYVGKSGCLSIDLLLADAKSTGSTKPAASARDSPPQYSDDPQFTVAGVTDPTDLGGHGSDVVVRTKEAVVKDTASLNRGSSPAPAPLSADSDAAYDLALAYDHSGDFAHASATLHALLAREDRADFHALLGDVDESEGNPLEAVYEDQRAAEMDPSEPHIFAWGAELLLHRALEPASEVFAKGNRLYPRSSRMLIGLGVASYSLGAYDQSWQQLAAACDIEPTDPNPYFFLAKIQEAEKVEPPDWTDRFKRFVALQPQNALAYYDYAVALMKEDKSPDRFARIAPLFQKATQLDPRLGPAYLKLGILYSEKKDLPNAIRAYIRAIETTPLPDEAHFRLAQIYRLTGDQQKARAEIDLFKRLSKQKEAEADRDRHEIRQFVFILNHPADHPSASGPAPQSPH
ncbi:MAG: tetratricopeptide repeat protein [Candidatus Acidiferrales bacterium]